MPHKKRQQLLAKLIAARNELEDVLSQTANRARYDPVVLSESRRNELAALKGELERLIRLIEQSW